MLKLLFAGTPDVAVPSLKAFAADPRFDVKAVLTRPDAPTGRGRRLTPSPVKAAALELGIPVIDAKPRDPGFLDTLAGLDVDIAAVIAYGNILPKAVLDAVPLGWYNLHFSNLPAWRGAAPVQRSIWAGDRTTGADVFKVGEGLDDGPVIATMSVDLTGRETSGELLDRLAVEGAPMYVDALASVGEGTAVFTPQPEGEFEYAHKITVDDARIDLTQPVEAIDRQIRACTPAPGAWCELYPEGKPAAGETVAEADEHARPLTLHVLAARPADLTNPNAPQALAPGELKAGKRNVWVGTGTDPLELLQVKAQGKKAMRAADWARGARLAPAARLD
ncbi:methionyl-tRNA formyltransferase [Bifidobacterium sp. UTCIF-37]|uniref:Methionyl-tRNA formyltransferase n=1 Tax=Bifidobacterium callitrichos TaxID=762209 RepID=A0A2T3GA77_9BIFI|nr:MULTISPECIES: methionyl-tRNA formyltransferase [Bifidobacterium]PST46400.1 methionyl-tRNA formyltransferase [Bifidobacterium callitrichos]TPF86448.1 methionyl-tRNA formyltransferase [Bifidobacterium sp. UTCIF-37]TPF89398.1 methionyl-tRNA formyltransferase [Bifidobacterium sp. UTCIF-38]